MVASIAGLAAVFSVCSCAEPLVESGYMRSADAPVAGHYVFDLNLTDTLSTYTLSFYSVIDGVTDGCPVPEMDVEVGLRSPSGQKFSETVGLPSGKWRREGKMQAVFREVYRDGFVPSEYGVWTLELDVAPACTGLCGIGYELKRNR
ncbi:MAG: hypothetical protein ACI395_08235 [Candidatus Cryptobacteroides sp.]